MEDMKNMKGEGRQDERLDMTRRRNRLHYAMLAGVVIVAGLASRSPLAESWPVFLSAYAGDTLWALMLFLGVGFLFPRMRTRTVASIVLALAYGVEFSQLCQAPWLEAFRCTLPGALTVGSGFLGSDFVCYTAGCALGVLGESIRIGTT